MSKIICCWDGNNKCLSIVVALCAIWWYYGDDITDRIASSSFLTATRHKITPNTTWEDLTWNYSEPLAPTYLIDHYYPNIIETVLLRRPWSSRILDTEEDFYSVKDELPGMFMTRYQYDYRCVVGGNIYFDSRYITNVRGPYLNQDGDLEHFRSFIVIGNIQAVPFKDANYETVCPENKNSMKFESGSVVNLPYSDTVTFKVNITEYWSRETRNDTMECNKVTFHIMNDTMWASPGFSYQYKAQIDRKLINPYECLGVTCAWKSILDGTWAMKTVKKRMEEREDDGDAISESLIIRPGRANYTVYPGQRWPRFPISISLPLNDYGLSTISWVTLDD